MINCQDEKTGDLMNLPKSLLFKTIKEAIATGQDQSINDLTDIIYGGLCLQTVNETRFGEISRHIESQNLDIGKMLEALKTGFSDMDRRFNDVVRQMDSRFNTLIHEMDSRFDAVFHEMDRRFELVEKRFEQVDKRFEQVDKRFEQVERRFEQVDKRFEQVERRFEQVDKRFEQEGKRFDDLIHQMDKRFEQMDSRFTFMTWLVGIGFVSINTLVVLLRIFS